MEEIDEELEEEMMQQLRFKATELLLREEWKESIQVYTHFISLSLNHLSKTTTDSDRFNKLQKTLCLAFSNRAEAKSRTHHFMESLEDCNQALKIDKTHFKTLVCKGKILLNLNQYVNAYDCFKSAALHDHDIQNHNETLNGYLDTCKKLEYQSRTGVFDLSDWVLNGFKDKTPELAEYIGPVEVKKSGISGRGLFSSKNVEAGTLLFVTKAVATNRGILPECDEDSKMVMWKDFVEKVVDVATKCRKTYDLICRLSTGEEEEMLQVPDISLFRPDSELSLSESVKPEVGKILNILDVNSLTEEDGISAKVLGKNSDYYGVGLWILASFINHSCEPNARRLHVGDHLMVHASRDIKAGEEIFFAYFDVLTPLKKRAEMSKTWGFSCECNRCRFERDMYDRNQGLTEIEILLECGSDIGNVVVRLEEGMKRWMLKGGKKEKGYLRASFWRIFSEAYQSERSMARWGRRIPPAEVVGESVAEAVGTDERVLKMVVEGLRRNGASGGFVEMEKEMKLARNVYGKVIKKRKAVKALLELCLCKPTC
ncbi:hypothetical protein MKW94_014973 [Papaver nudicaule]|uniref:SET domain-containing protein n=1 Tax=Papaver nudicaule TaxID=74823 RepID=A0AA41SBE8_PAPNU|nr:hypothetical protein [Papaver nudicaule]